MSSGKPLKTSEVRMQEEVFISHVKDSFNVMNRSKKKVAFSGDNFTTISLKW